MGCESPVLPGQTFGSGPLGDTFMFPPAFGRDEFEIKSQSSAKTRREDLSVADSNAGGGSLNIPPACASSDTTCRAGSAAVRPDLSE